MSESQMGQAYRQRLGEARDELSKDGWEILTPEREAALSVPAKLIELEPDIVAMKDGELLIGEVKSRNSRELNDLNELAEAVALLSNTRLEVYWLGDEPGSEPSREVIRDYVEEARVLLRTGHFAAAAVIAWAALEGALERFVSDTQLPIAANSEHVLTAWPLVSRLYSLGYVSEGDFRRLAVVRKQRNAAVHFGRDDPPNAGDIEFTLRLVERMVAGRYVSVDRMVEWYVDRYDYPDVPARDSDRLRVQAVLEEHFPGTPESEVEEAITRLYHEAAL